MLMSLKTCSQSIKGVIIVNNKAADPVEEAKEFMESESGNGNSSRIEVARTGRHDMDSLPITMKDARMWANYGDTFSPCERAVENLPAGQYTVEHSHERGIFFQRHAVNLDDLLILPDSASEEVIQGIEYFWTREENFREFGFLWKRGVMLYGPPGSGKTSTLQILSKKIVERDGISVYISNPSLGAKGLELLRRIEPTRPLVVMLEDIDAIVQEYGEPELLALLDGELQIDNVVFIATTNYPERLDKRLKNRPSRFDIIKKIGMPSPAARETYLLAKNPRLQKNPEELMKWVKSTDGFSVAHLKELIVSVEVLNTPFDLAHKRLKVMIQSTISSEEENRNIGFTSGTESP